MNLLLAFAPFLTFALVDRLAGALPGLAGGALVAAVLVLRDVVSPGRKVKILEVGTLTLFSALAGYTFLAGASWTIVGVRLWVDTGLLLIVVISIVVRRPFTLPYAREKSPVEVWTRPEFLRSNDVISAVWAAAFALMVAADLLMLYVPTLPLRVGIWVTVLALLGASKFTEWYPNRKGMPGRTIDVPR